MIQEGMEVQNDCIINRGVKLVTSIRLSCRDKTAMVLGILEKGTIRTWEMNADI